MSPLSADPSDDTHPTTTPPQSPLSLFFQKTLPRLQQSSPQHFGGIFKQGGGVAPCPTKPFILHKATDLNGDITDPIHDSGDSAGDSVHSSDSVIVCNSVGDRIIGNDSGDGNDDCGVAAGINAMLPYSNDASHARELYQRLCSHHNGVHQETTTPEARELVLRILRKVRRT